MRDEHTPQRASFTPRAYLSGAPVGRVTPEHSELLGKFLDAINEDNRADKRPPVSAGQIAALLKKYGARGTWYGFFKECEEARRTGFGFSKNFWVTLQCKGIIKRKPKA